MSKKSFIVILVAVAALLFVFLSSSDSATESATAATTGMPAMPVDVQVITPEDAVVWDGFTGRIEPVEHAVIKPEVSGRITEIRFQDGENVSKGDILIVVDPAPLNAALAEAEAALQIAQSEAALAETEYQRARTLRDSDAISQGLYEERLRNRSRAAAAVKASRALRDSAKINLEYAYIKAPISGVISRAELTIGNRVESGTNAPVLTEIIQQSPVYVDFNIDEQSFIRLKSLDRPATSTPVRLNVAGTSKTYMGSIHSFDNQISLNSGTVRARALFENTDGVLLPGMTADVEVGMSSDDMMIIVPQTAIGTDQDRKFVYVMNDEQAVEYRPVTLGATIDDRRVVSEGLNAGDRLITSGIVKLRPGAPVQEKQPEPATELPDDMNAIPPSTDDAITL